ncbi:HAD hydrolase-like protein [Robertmurraya sp. Marseille-Q9965]
MKYSTIIFDLDGTLLDTSEGIMVGASYTVQKLGIAELTMDQQKSFIGPPLLESFMRECGLTKNEAEIAVSLYRERYQKKGLYEAKHYHQMEELLFLLKKKGFKLAVATLKMDRFAKEILEYFGLLHYFDSINGIDEKDTLSKKDIIQLCLKEIEEYDYSKVVLIGDSIFDAIGAKEAGIDFIGVTYGFGFKAKEDIEQVDAVFTAKSVKDIMGYLEV